MPELEALATETARLIGHPTAYALIMDALQRVQASHAARTLSQSRKGKPLTEKELERNQRASAIAAAKKLAKRKPPEWSEKR